MSQMQKLLVSLAINNNQRDPSDSSSSADPHSSRNILSNTFANASPSVSTGQSVKFLSSQIPFFSDSDDDDIELWIEKIENVSHIHGLSPAVMMSAAANNLTKTPTNLGLTLKRLFSVVSREKFPLV